MTLQQHFEDACRTPSDINGHVAAMSALVVELDAKVVIELGTRTGVSTFGWLHGLYQTGGHLWSVDIDAKPPIGDFDRWTFMQGDDCDPELFASLPVADIVFIDTSHAYLHTLQELNLYRWLVRPGGRIVCHDTELAHPEDATPWPAFPVKKAINEFCAAESLSWHNFPHCNGLGIIEIGD